MSTNYYARFNICECCKKGEQIHIGKYSSGWKFLFRGYRTELNELGLKSFDSFEDWKIFLMQDWVKIINEYEDEISYQDFMRVVEESKNNPNDHIDFCKNKGYKEDSLRSIDGFPVLFSEFC